MNLALVMHEYSEGNFLKKLSISNFVPNSKISKFVKINKKRQQIFLTHCWDWLTGPIQVSGSVCMTAGQYNSDKSCFVVSKCVCVCVSWCVSGCL